MKWLLDLLTQLKEEQWYGKVTLSFEAGKVTLVRKEETLKPPQESQ